MASSQQTSLQQTPFTRGRGLDIPDRGVDSRVEVRPGVPMEMEPHPIGRAHWRQPERQPPPPWPREKRADLERLTPCFGTAQPLRGVSGMIRRAAYNIPDHRASHWMLKIFADRVDVLEHGSGRSTALLALAIPAIAIGVAVFRRQRQPWYRRVFA